MVQSYLGCKWKSGQEDEIFSQESDRRQSWQWKMFYSMLIYMVRYQIEICLPFSLYLSHGYCSEWQQPNPNRVNQVCLFKYLLLIFIPPWQKVGIKLKSAYRFPFIWGMVFALNQSKHIRIGLNGKFTRHNIKLSYCTMGNMRTVVNIHNSKLLLGRFLRWQYHAHISVSHAPCLAQETVPRPMPFTSVQWHLVIQFKPMMGPQHILP